MSKRTRLSAAERREQILEGAMTVFAQRGYQDASMVEIARAGGVTAAVIYDHFASKQELHRLLLEEQTYALMAHVAGALVDTGPDLTKRMENGVNAFFQFVESHPYAWRLIFREPPADPEIADTHTRIHALATQGIAGFFNAATSGFAGDGQPPEQTLEMFAEMLKMALNGLAGWWYEHPDVPREELVRRVMEFCWTGLEQVAAT